MKLVIKGVLIFIAVFSAVQGVSFQCAFSNFNWIDSGGLLYTCTATVSIAGDDTTLNSVTGTHMSGRTNANVTALTVSHFKLLETIPENIQRFFPNLRLLQWYNGTISRLSPVDLQQFPNLQTLNLQLNPIVILDAALFQGTQRLQWISFSDNLLENIGYDLLTDLSELTSAFFSRNPCINFRATTPDEIQLLALQLSVVCPPLVTTLAPPTLPDWMLECSAACMENMEIFHEQSLAETNDLRREIREIQSENEQQSIDTRTTISVLNTDVQNLRRDSEQQIANILVKTETLQNEVNILEQRNYRQISEIQTETENLRGEITDLREEHVDGARDMQGEINDLRSEMDDVQQENVQLYRDIAAMNRIIDAHARKLEELENLIKDGP